MNKNYAFFVCSDGGYLPYLNAFLNSLDMFKLQVPTYVLHYNFPKEYLDEAQKTLNYPVIPVQIDKGDFNIHQFNKNNNNLFIKQSRFKYIRELGVKHDVMCMMDADMFITTKNFTNLFDLVAGTRKMIGCNERFKWSFDRKYIMNGKPLFEQPIKAWKFHCSVPIFMDMKEWTDVFDFYNEMAYNSFEVDPTGKILKPVGDIYCWNMSVYKKGRENDVVLFPMETMTQVHHTYTNPWTKLQPIGGGMWNTFAGDEVFSIHGRVGNKAWYDGQVRGVESTKKNLGITAEIGQGATGILKAVARQWVQLTCKHKIDVRKFGKNDPYWEELLK